MPSSALTCWQLFKVAYRQRLLTFKVGKVHASPNTGVRGSNSSGASTFSTVCIIAFPTGLSVPSTLVPFPSCFLFSHRCYVWGKGSSYLKKVEIRFLGEILYPLQCAKVDNENKSLRNL